LAQNSLKMNFVFNLIGMAAPVAIALVTVPIYITHIGAARYGVLSMIWILLGYFGFLDFGLSGASANALAKLAHASKKEWAEVFITSLYLNVLFGAFAGTLLYFFGNLLLHHLLPLSDAIKVELDVAFPWIAFMLPVALMGGVARGAIESRERFSVMNVLDMIAITLGQILPILCIIIIGPSLTVVLPAAFVARLLSVGLALAWVVRAEKLDAFQGFDWSRFKQLLKFGAWFSVTNVISPLLASLDQFLIGSKIGAAAVAYYAVPMNLVTRSQIIASALTRALFPRFSRLQADEAMLLAGSAVVSLGYGLGAICGPAIVVGAAFLSLWIGADFSSHAAPVLRVLLVGAWINGIAFIPYSLMQGQGRPDLVAKLHAIEFLPFIVILWFLLERFGLPGAALAWSGRVAVDAALLLKVSRVPLCRLLRLAPALILILGCYVVSLADLSMLSSVAIAGLMFAAFGGCAIAFDTSARRLVRPLRASAEYV
jgi:O-antigen/teichoic acid export membrane protein